jgi:hypothetical protein
MQPDPARRLPPAWKWLLIIGLGFVLAVGAWQWWRALQTE